MERVEIFNQLNRIFEDVIDEGAIHLTEETNSGDIEGWDSLAHIQLIVQIEKHFNVKFSAKEMLTWNNVGAMVDCIISKK